MATENRNIKITKPEYFAAASCFTCTKFRDDDNFRKYVMIEPAVNGGIYIIGTDGQKMVVFFDEDGDANTSDCIYVSKALFNATKLSKSSPDSIVINDEKIIVSKKNTVVHQQNVTTICKNGVPDWRGVIPDDKPSVISTIGVEICPITDFSRMLKAAFGSKSLTTTDLQFRFCSKEKPILVTSNTYIFKDDSRKSWFGLLMPRTVTVDIEPVNLTDALPFPV